jgi:hypothetical protein
MHQHDIDTDGDTDGDTAPAPGDEGPGPTPRPKRADARRNQARLVAAAREVFAEAGPGASMEAIACPLDEPA